MLQGGPTGPTGLNPQGPIGTPPQLPSSNPTTSQPGSQQQGLMMSQTNTMAMGGGQITQNIVTSSSPSGAGLGNVIGQGVPRMRMQVNI